MNKEKLIQQQLTNTEEIIQELLEAGSDPNALYVIEHHLSSSDLEQLQQIAAQAFQLGYDISDIEELDVDQELIMYCVDLIKESPLGINIIHQQTIQIIDLLNLININYDGWGTYYEEQSDLEENYEQSILH